MRVQIVSFHCVLKNQLGQLISSSFNHDVTTSPGPSEPSALPGFIAGLKGVKEGEKKKIFVAADQAYGLYNPSLFKQVLRGSIHRGHKLKVGDNVRASLTGDGVVRLFRVVAANPQEVMLEGNHPLAGQDLVFDIEVTSSREESEELPGNYN